LSDKRIKCKFCSKDFSDKTGIDSLRYHQKLHQSVSDNLKITIFSISDRSNKSFDDYLIEIVIDGQHPFSIVDEENFRALIKSLSPQTNIPSRDSLKRKIISKFNVLKENIKENLNHVNSKVSLTWDIWSSISGHTYLAITVHFTNEKFEMKNFLLDLDLIPFPHDGQKICNIIKEILFEFNFETKFIALTTDNAKNNVKGIRLY